MDVVQAGIVIGECPKIMSHLCMQTILGGNCVQPMSVQFYLLSRVGGICLLAQARRVFVLAKVHPKSRSKYRAQRAEYRTESEDHNWPRARLQATFTLEWTRSSPPPTASNSCMPLSVRS